ncbi:hypothetical protein F2P79_005567 [Pimephales promelas]|nr:hypothetical protein F2P79_005567 [Pimephales promelas]KAG1961517.1 hypothetical protein F2P79_005567 [Pimephales promelas]
MITCSLEAVMKPHFWPLSSLEMMCWGQLVVFRCWSERGTDVQYTWYRVGKPNNIVLHNSTDLHLHCSNITEDSQLFCLASNDVSSQSSEFISLQILQPADKNCVNLISSKGLGLAYLYGMSVFNIEKNLEHLKKTNNIGLDSG